MGLNVFNIFLLGLSFTAFIIASGFITDASRRIGNLPEKETNKDLQNAHKWSIWAAVIGWITVALLLVALGIFIYLSVVLSEEEYATGTGGFSNYFINGALFLALAGIITVGIFSILTANDIKKSEVPDNNNSYRNAIIAAVISTITFVAIIVVFIIKLVYKPKSKVDSQISTLESELGEEDPLVPELPVDLT